MRDLLSNLSTNLHILVIAMLIVGLGLGMITSSGSGSGGKPKRDQTVINLSTTPSVPPKQPPDNPGQSGSSGQSDTPPTPAAPATGPGNGSDGHARPHPKQSHPSHTATPSETDAAAAPSTDTPGQLNLPCAMCDDTATCPDSCLTQNQTALPWRKPQPPATICCGGRTVTIPYQPTFVICPTSCGGTAGQ